MEYILIKDLLANKAVPLPIEIVEEPMEKQSRVKYRLQPHYFCERNIGVWE